jgi:hypothetical protein
MLICVCLCIHTSSRIPRYDLGRQTPHFWGGSVTKLHNLNRKLIHQTSYKNWTSLSIRIKPSLVCMKTRLLWRHTIIIIYNKHLLLRSCSFVGVFTPARYRVVKIACSCSEVVLWTTKHTMVYPGSSPSLEVIALRPTVWYWRWTVVTMGWAESSRSSWGEGGNDLVPPT